MASIKCKLLLPAHKQKVYVRSYSWGEGKKCKSGNGRTHYARFLLGTFSLKYKKMKDDGSIVMAMFPYPVEGDPLWEKVAVCSLCNEYRFTENDGKTIDQQEIWILPDTQKEVAWEDAPPGSMKLEKWPGNWVGKDGKTLVVKLPDGIDWNVDSMANNCNERETEHKCWERSGEAPNITVTKGGSPRHTGGGSIMGRTYHGFLRGGELVEA